MSVVDAREAEILEFAQRLAHHVDVVDVEELDGAVRVRLFAFVATAFRLQ